MKDRYLIVDEVSMLGRNMMARVDKGLRQATTHLDTPFGGISVILIGDFAQLPPVGDRPLFAGQVHMATQCTIFLQMTSY